LLHAAAAVAVATRPGARRFGPPRSSAGSFLCGSRRILCASAGPPRWVGARRGGRLDSGTARASVWPLDSTACLGRTVAMCADCWGVGWLSDRLLAIVHVCGVVCCGVFFSTRKVYLVFFNYYKSLIYLYLYNIKEVTFLSTYLFRPALP
jgi:hypothetical protein